MCSDFINLPLLTIATPIEQILLLTLFAISKSMAIKFINKIIYIINSLQLPLAQSLRYFINKHLRYLFSSHIIYAVFFSGRTGLKNFIGVSNCKGKDWSITIGDTKCLNEILVVRMKQSGFEASHIAGAQT